MSPEELTEEVIKLKAERTTWGAVQAVNTRWMVIAASIVLAALGYTNFVQIPAEATKAAKAQMGPKVVKIKILKTDGNPIGVPLIQLLKKIPVF